jgi:hypothetical protein
MHHVSFVDRDEARSQVFDYIEVFYRQRLHSALNHSSPTDFEKMGGAQLTCPRNQG